MSWVEKILEFSNRGVKDDYLRISVSVTLHNYIVLKFKMGFVFMAL